MTKPDVTRFPGVQKRNDSNVYQFGLRAPVDLAAHFPSGWAVRCSLKTPDLREANDRARELHAEWATRFDSLRNSRPAPLDLSALRAQFLARVEGMLSKFDARAASWTAAEREGTARDIAVSVGELREALKGGSVPDWAEVLLDRWSYQRSRVADAEALAFLLMSYELYHETATEETRTYPLRVQRLGEKRALIQATRPQALAGEVAVSPLAQPEPRTGLAVTAGKAPRMCDALDSWKSVAARPEKTVGTFARHVAQFETMMGDPPLSTLRRADAVRFRDALQAWAVAEKKTADTANNVLVSIKALVGVAQDREWISGNPFDRLTVVQGGRTTKKREPWTADELGVLFNDPIWMRCELPTAPKAAHAAAYWLPILACYSGARLSELAQLHKADITTAKGREVIEFREDEDQGQRLKTEGSWRAVPMHSELVRLGLPAYVNALPEGPLFPLMRIAGKNGAGGQFGQWFGEFKAARGFTSASKTFHSFRHLVASELRLRGATDPQADAITGHAGEGIGRTVYSATIRRQAEALRPVIELLRFPALDALPVVGPWSGGHGS